MSHLMWGVLGDAGADVKFRYADWERARTALSEGPEDDDLMVVRGLD